MILATIVAAILLVVFARRRQISAALIVTLLAVVVSGMTAGTVVSPVFYATTIAVVGLMVRASSQPQRATAKLDDSILKLPPALQASVTRALDEIGPGEARELLLGVVGQGAALYEVASARFDEREERATRRNVDDLLEACCESAIDLDRLDRVVSSAPARMNRGPGAPPTPSGEVNRRLSTARELLVRRLSDAATSLRALYAADVEHGTQASERVATLAAEIKSDASARSGAIAEMKELLS
jgi:hypothetical protein